jgi:hypothetical protein
VLQHMGAQTVVGCPQGQPCDQVLHALGRIHIGRASLPISSIRQRLVRRAESGVVHMGSRSRLGGQALDTGKPDRRA